jgi:hypothetical protein
VTNYAQVYNVVLPRSVAAGVAIPHA